MSEALPFGKNRQIMKDSVDGVALLLIDCSYTYELWRIRWDYLITD